MQTFSHESVLFNYLDNLQNFSQQLNQLSSSTFQEEATPSWIAVKKNKRLPANQKIAREHYQSILIETGKTCLYPISWVLPQP